MASNSCKQSPGFVHSQGDRKLGQSPYITAVHYLPRAVPCRRFWMAVGEDFANRGPVVRKGKSWPADLAIAARRPAARGEKSGLRRRRSPPKSARDIRPLGQSTLIASLGQTGTQAPQSPQVVSSTTALPSVMVMESSGQDETHSSHPVHFSGFTCADIEYLRLAMDTRNTIFIHTRKHNHLAMPSVN